MTTQVTNTMTVRELVGRYPQTRQVFERYGIDYCCGGGVSLAVTASRHNVELPVLTKELEQAIEKPPSAVAKTERDWYAEPLGLLVDHIVQTHHAYLNQALPRLRHLLATVLKAHQAHHGPMLQEAWRLFSSLDDELRSHLMKEEQILFPYIVAIEAASRKEVTPPPTSCGSVGNPIRQMEHEHDSAGRVLEELRRTTGDYTLPADACPTFAALYEGLQQLEADLHQHIHLENNILFPRAQEMEREIGGSHDLPAVVSLTTPS
jgi:regulator of cell morphogenesis and NO signaling